MESTSGNKLSGKVAVITGAASGIGAATTRLFVANGAKVVIADIQDKLGQALAQELTPNAHFIHCDVRMEEQVMAAINHAVSQFGQIDIMFNNAGVVSTGIEASFAAITDIEASELDHVCNVNIKGTMFGVKHAAKAMMNREGCSIINTCSIAAVIAQKTYHCYTISKHAILGITKTAASELNRYGIRVNCISPAALFTSMTEETVKFLKPEMTADELKQAYMDSSELKGVRLEAEDIAKAALFLSSTDAKYISGQNIVLDGAFSASKPLNLFGKAYE